MKANYPIIDIHTHAFPDAIAERTVSHLAAVGDMRPEGNGTVAALKARMRESGVSLAVNLPVVTRPGQYRSVLEFAEKISNESDGLISFGGIHPLTDSLDRELDGIAERGLLGIKLHPDYQGVRIDDPHFIATVRGALRRGLHVLTHAGLDVAYPNDIHALPDATARLLDAVGGLQGRGRLILAHLGGIMPSEELLRRHIIGRDVMLDLAYIVRHVPADSLRDVIRAHGAERVVFGSDYPWSDPRADIETLCGLGMNEDELSRILYGNAAHLLRLGNPVK